MGLDFTPLIGPPTGISQHTANLADALSKRDDIELSGWLLSARGRLPASSRPVRRCLVPASVATRCWARSRWPSKRLIAGAVDVVHGTNFLGPPHPTTVITIHDLTPLSRPDLTEPSVAAKAPAIRRAIEAGAWIHVPSEQVKRELLAVAQSERIVTVPHGVEAPQPSPPGAGTSLARLERYVLVLGTTEKRKRVPLVVAALASLPSDVGLVIAGPEGNDETAVESAVATHRLGQRVRRLKAVDRVQRDALLRDAHVVVLASEYEGFGFTPLEAALVETPFVATAVGALPELVGDRVSLINPAHPELVDVLSSACEEPLVDPKLRSRLQELSWSRAAEAMTELYRFASRA